MSEARGVRLTPRRHLALAMALGSVVAAGACASPGIPPGGPEDHEAPVLLKVIPDSGSRNVRAPRAVLLFNEVVNERSTPVAGAGGPASGGSAMGSGSGSANLAALVLISPSDGRERILWRREAIEIEPRGGFRPNTAYRITLLPGLGDLRANVRKAGVEYGFTTGAEIPAGGVTGALFDWVGGKAAIGARIEATLPGDTLFRWRARTDSTGRYLLRDLAPGRYRLRGWIDANNNGLVDPRESVDTASVTIATTAETQDLYTFERDTIGPRLELAELVDSTGLRFRFDRAPDVTWRPEAATVRLLRADSTPVPLPLPIPGAVFDSLRAARAAARDSAARDSLRSDSTRADTTTRRTRAVNTDSADAPRSAAATDSAASRPRPAVLARPVPVLTWVVPLSTPLPPGTYRLKVGPVRGLTGRVRDSERELRVRPPAPPKDSTSARRPGAGRETTRPPMRPPAT